MEEHTGEKMEATLLTLLLCAIFTCARGDDPLDLDGNITIRWDVMSWTPDGYVASVNITNNQRYRTVTEPGWRLGWTWARKEVIWRAVGARPLRRGDCSSFKGDVPASCMRSPTVVDLTAEAPLTDKIDGCCKGGVLLTKLQDARKSTTEFQIAVGNAGTTNRTVQMPKNYTLAAPGGGYSCSSAKIARPTRFVTPDGRRVTQALLTWQVVCRYSPLRGYKPLCCMSLSSDQGMKIPCSTCACNCKPSVSKSCVPSSSKFRQGKSPVQCTNNMCRVNINWHLLSESKGSIRRFEVSMSNLNNHVNYTDWILIIQHPAAQKLTTAIHANYRALPSKLGSAEVVWGIKHRNQVLAQLGSGGSTVKFILSYRGSPGKWNFSSDVFFDGYRCADPSLP